MANDTARPTTCTEVEATLRAIAAEGHTFPKLVAGDDRAGQWAFLFGLATATLAQTNAQLNRANAEIARLNAEMEAL